MIVTNSKSNQTKKCCIDSLSEEVTDGLAKPAHVVEERPEGILIRRLEI